MLPSIRNKALLGLIGLFSRHPVVDAVKLALYGPDFYPAGGLTQEAMRGPSEWTVADRELIAAFVSKVEPDGILRPGPHGDIIDGL
jgi:hypothetical protein